MRLTELPIELIASVLGFLDCPTLLKASQTNHQLHDVVRQDPSLRYAIELYADGLADNGTSNMLFSDRIEMLARRRKAWRTLNWEHAHLPKYSGFCTAYELVSGVFMKNLDPCQDLAELHEMRAMGWQPRDFAIDPTQDLGIFLRIVENHTQVIVLHLLTVSTSKRHPQAQSPAIFYTIPSVGRLPIESAFLQIAGDVVALFTLGDHDSHRLLAWNWTTGSLLFDIDSNWSELPHSLRPKQPVLGKSIVDFAFLTERSFVLSDRGSPGSLNVCVFDGLNPGEPHCVASLLLPPLAEGVEVLEVGAAGSDERPFSTDHQARIHLVHITYVSKERVSYRVLLVVHHRIYLKCLEDYRRTGTYTAVPWEQWGPANSRLIGSGERLPRFPWLRYVHGTKLVLPAVSIRVLDFCRGACRGVGPSATACESVAPFDAEYDAPFACSKPSITRCMWIFAKDVITSLPYFAVSKSVPFALHALLMDEDRILGIKDISEVTPPSPLTITREDTSGLHLFCI
ncbi:hypothetical protein DL96DRAFT_1607803 [Flagelloscypha sp. PMI_526]|nr:hypothetical protein DL96DRAFT_1607803 [Flagelloscypha sp. PMI_526]